SSQTPAEGALLEAAVTTSIELAELVGVVTAERTALEREVRSVKDALERLLHDLRKPVTALTSTIWLLRQHASEESGGPAREELAVAEGALKELMALLEDGAAKVARGDAPGEEAVDLGTVVAEVLRNRALEAREGRVEMRVRGTFPSVLGHRAT